MAILQIICTNSCDVYCLEHCSVCLLLNQIKHYIKLSSEEIADEIDAMSKKENNMW